MAYLRSVLLLTTLLFCSAAVEGLRLRGPATADGNETANDQGKSSLTVVQAWEFATAGQTPPYDKWSRPGKREGVEFVVTLSINIYNFQNFDEKESTWSFNGYIRVSWTDNRLKLPPGMDKLDSRDCPGSACIVYSAIHFDTSKDDRGELIIKNLYSSVRTASSFQLFAGGKITTWIGGAYTLYLGRTTSFAMFPFDKHMLPIAFETVSVPYVLPGGSPGFRVAMRLEDMVTNTYNKKGLQDAQWTIYNMTTEEEMTTYASTKATYQTPSVQLHLRRQVTNYIWKNMVPSVMLAMMSSISYWINPSVAPARVGLCVTLLLSQFALMQTLARELPRVAYLTWMDIFLIIGFLKSCLSLFMFGIVYNTAQDKEKGAERAATIDAVCRVLLPVVYLALISAMIIVAVQERPAGNGGPVSPE